MLKKDSKRRRTKAEIAQQEQEKLAEENAIRAKLARIDELEARVAQAEQQQMEQESNREAAALLNDLINSGVVRQESEHCFVAANQEGERRFDYSQE